MRRNGCLRVGLAYCRPLGYAAKIKRRMALTKITYIITVSIIIPIRTADWSSPWATASLKSWPISTCKPSPYTHTLAKPTMAKSNRSSTHASSRPFWPPYKPPHRVVCNSHNNSFMTFPCVSIISLILMKKIIKWATDRRPKEMKDWLCCWCKDIGRCGKVAGSTNG